MHKFTSTLILSALLTATLSAASPQQLPDPLPRPDGKAADMKKPVQVYILMGQSNMLGFGKPQGLAAACKDKGLYPYLIDESGAWTVRKDVRYVRVMCSGSGPSKTYNNEWMTIKGNIGPEMGIGHYVGHVTKAPVLILKSCIGNRSLGYDLLPPSAEGYQGDPGPSRKPRSGPWYAGVQYDGDVTAAKQVLANLGQHYPGARRYEVAGFFWWQGDKDFRNAQHAEDYEKNLLCLIESLRKDFKAPNAKFVCATLGQTRKGAGGPQGKILEGTLNIDGALGKYKSHKGKVASVYSHPLSRGGSSSGHYGGNAETYMNVGQAMGQAMAKLIMNSAGSVPNVDFDVLDASLKGVYKSIVAGRLNRANKSIQPYLVEGSSKSQDQVALARKLDKHVTYLIEDSIGTLDSLKESGDYCQLRDELAKNGKNLQGIAAYDGKQKVWATELATEKAVREMAVGDTLKGIVARKKRVKSGVYFGLLDAFRKANPDSAYASKAAAEMKPIEASLEALFAKIASYEELGDVQSKYQVIKEAKSEYARIPAFDEAHKKWTAESRTPEVRQAMTAGAAYVAIFDDVAKLDRRLKSSLDKNMRISGRHRRTQADNRARIGHERKLKPLAVKLRALAKKYAGGYYGMAAERSLEAYRKSEGKALPDGREK